MRHEVSENAGRTIEPRPRPAAARHLPPPTTTAQHRPPLPPPLSPLAHHPPPPPSLLGVVSASAVELAAMADAAVRQACEHAGLQGKAGTEARKSLHRARATLREAEAALRDAKKAADHKKGGVFADRSTWHF